jgi:hypothetical protein
VFIYYNLFFQIILNTRLFKINVGDYFPIKKIRGVEMAAKKKAASKKSKAKKPAKKVVKKKTTTKKAKKKK